MTQLPSRMSRQQFIASYAELFEESPWVAEAAWDAGICREQDDPRQLHRALCRAMRAAAPERLMALIQAHPQLADRARPLTELTDASAREQRSAGLDRLSPEQAARFLELNRRYQERFGFPFILAVAGLEPEAILRQIEQRLDHRRQQEIETALDQIEQIAWLRLKDLE